jgi:hypothetical protein
MPRAYTFLVIVGLAFVPAVACRSTPDVPDQTGEGPVEPNADHAVQQAEKLQGEKEHKEPVELKPVGLGGGPQDESSSSTAETPTPTPKPTPITKPTPKPKPTGTTKPSTSPTLPLPPWPTTWPSTWWPFPPSASATATQGPKPPTP